MRMQFFFPNLLLNIRIEIVVATNSMQNQSKDQFLNRLSIMFINIKFFFNSIDNLRMRSCFEPNNHITFNGKCPASDVKCKSRKKDTCISFRQQCDINIDCDNKEDEMVNCGKLRISFFYLNSNDWDRFNFDSYGNVCIHFF